MLAIDLRRRLRQAGRPAANRRRAAALGLVLTGLGLVGMTPVLASGRALRLQGANLAGEFIAQPHWLAPGSLDGQHVRLESGLLGLVDASGTLSSGYCVDARTHRRHGAVYTEGPLLLDSTIANPGPVAWLLAHAYPNGPVLRDTGAARTSSAVQAAIWHLSDGFDLDPAGAPGVDAAYRAVYDELLRDAAAGAAAGAAATRVELRGNPVAGGQVEVLIDVVGGDGAAGADGAEVTLSTDAGSLATAPAAGAVGASRLVARTGAGRASAWLTLPRAMTVLTVHAEASIPVVRGRTLLGTSPTQRLVEAVPGREVSTADARLQVAAPVVTPAPTTSPSAAATPAPSPSPPTAPSPLPTARPSAAPPPRVAPPAVVSLAPPPPPPATQGPVAPTPLETPRPPASGGTAVTMPITGRLPRAPLSLAMGLMLSGMGLLLGAWPGVPSRTPRRVRYRHNPAHASGVSGCAHP